MQLKRVLVVGAGGALGEAVVRRLAAQGAEPVAAFRTPRAGLEQRLEELGAAPRRLDLLDRDAFRIAVADADAAIFTPILSVSAARAGDLGGRTAVFLSSNNVAIDAAAPVYAALREAEAIVASAAPQARILRPTMIYGYPGDGNASRLMRSLMRFPFFPVFGDGAARQQPVFYEDLAQACVDALSANTGEPPPSVAGPDIVTQRKFIRLVGEAAGVRARLLRTPLGPARAVAEALARLRIPAPVSAAQIARAQTDKTPRGADPLIMSTPLVEGLAALARALDDHQRDA